MATIADELNAISVEHGYTGAAPKTIAGAIDALADTLAGTDVEGKRTIAGAVKALAPYIGSGGGGSLGALVDVTMSVDVSKIYVSTTEYDLIGETWTEVEESLDANTNVCIAENYCMAPGGCYLAIEIMVPSDWSTDSVQVTFNDDEISDFECKKMPSLEDYKAYLTVQIPQSTGDLYIDFGIE